MVYVAKIRKVYYSCFITDYYLASSIQYDAPIMLTNTIALIQRFKCQIARLNHLMIMVLAYFFALSHFLHIFAINTNN